MKINDIKDKDLIYFGERTEPYFASSMIIRGMVNPKNLKNVLKWKSGVRWLYTNNYFFIKKDDLAKAQIELKKKFKENGVGYTRALIEKCLNFGERLISISKDTKKKSERDKLRRNEMQALLKKYIEAASHYMIFQNIALFEDAVSELAHGLANKYSKTEKEANKLLSLITSANRLTAVEKEQDDFLRLAAKKKTERSISWHTKEYGWLSLRFFVGEPWNEEYVENKLKNTGPSEAKREFAKRLEFRENREAQIKEVIRSFDERDKKTVSLIRDIVFLRTQRTDFFQESSFYVRDLVKKIASELNISYDNLLFLSAQEVLLALENKFDYLECIEYRKTGFLVFFDYDKDIVLESKKVVAYIKKRPILNREIKSAKKLIGKTGFRGKTVGKVKIVKSEKDNAKIEEGDILVSIMTTSNLLPALKKAAAIVTDEGGITCHAAIIARELGKPCIIGTKIATKVLKDGDLVEVDADKGVVKILKSKVKK